jgi:hypothetical protein
MQFIKCMVTYVVEHPGVLTEESFEDFRQQVKAPRGNPGPRPVGKDEDPNLSFDEAKIVNDMPRNTVVVVPVGPANQVTSVTERLVCYPFFSSHFSLPVKEGEYVWVFSEQPFENELDVGPGPFYWVSRVHGSLLSEDVSFTHYERQFEFSNLRWRDEDLTNKDLLDAMKNYTPGFPSNIFADTIKDSVLTAMTHDIEPVPRLTKSRTDLVLQGSHNTSIMLGTSINEPNPSERVKKDQGVEVDEATPRSEYDSPESLGGAIDIVVGRSNNLRLLTEANYDPSISHTKSGDPITVKNTRDEFEVNKNPSFLETLEDKKIDKIKHARYFNMREGDPNFITDACRIYMSRNDDVDSKFRLGNIMANSVYDGFTPSEFGTNTGGSTNQFETLSEYNAVYPILVDDSAPSIVAKSNNIRLIARSIDHESNSSFWKDASKLESADPEGFQTSLVEEEAQDPEEVKFEGEQGSIIIIKEGKLQDRPNLMGEVLTGDDLFYTEIQDTSAGPGPFLPEHASETGNGRAVVALAADGTIYIDGPRIVIGSGNEKANGKGTQIAFGLNAYEPTVLGGTLNETLQAFMEDVIKFITETFTNHEHSTGTGPTGPAGTGLDVGTTPTAVQTHGSDMQAMIDRLNLHLSRIAKTK